MLGPYRIATLRHYSTNIAQVITNGNKLTGKPTINYLIRAINDKLISDNDTLPRINGFIQSIKNLKNVTFVDLYDGTCSEPLKLVIPRTRLKSLGVDLKMGQTLDLTNWKVKLTPERIQTFELVMDPVSELKLLGDIHTQMDDDTVRETSGMTSSAVATEYPLQMKQRLTLPFLRQHPLVKHKTNYLASVMRFRSHVMTKLINILTVENGFIMCNPPLLTKNDTEGNNETFKTVPKKLNLTVSTQLHLEILAQNMKNVFTITPCFRAEMSDTGRHLAEFWMLELESVNIVTLEELIHTIKTLLISLGEALLRDPTTPLPNDTLLPNDTCNSKDIRDRWVRVSSPQNWHTITYTDAVNIINENTSDALPPITWGEPLASVHEKYISETHFMNGFVFITQYPREIKPFYMKWSDDSGKTVDCLDLIFPHSVGELAGGSLREDRIDKLNDAIQSNGGDNTVGELQWYVDLRRMGSFPRGGFGIGIERLLCYFFACKNVKDTIPFYRVMKEDVML